MKTIFIIYGGKSVEHDISIITALQVYKTAVKNYDCKLVYIDGKGKWWMGKNLSNPSIYADFDKKCKKKKSVKPIFGEGFLLIGRKKVKPYCVILCNHGLNGEDGSLASVMNLLNVPYVSSSILSSAVTMDKVTTKMVLSFNKINSTDFCYVKKGDDLHSLNLDFPVIVKPANLGSSVGISVCRNLQDFFSAVEIAFEFDDKVLIEKYLENAREFNCACFKYKDKLITSNVIEVKKGEIFSFEEKYLKEPLSDEKSIDNGPIEKVLTLTRKVYEIFDCFGIVRIDFLYSNGELYVNELNSIPGALSSYMFNEKFDEILDLLIEEGVRRFNDLNDKNYSFKSNALKLFERLSDKYIAKK